MRLSSPDDPEEGDFIKRTGLDFLECLRREAMDQALTHETALPLLNARRSSRVKGQPELPWEP